MNSLILYILGVLNALELGLLIGFILMSIHEKKA